MHAMSHSNVHDKLLHSKYLKILQFALVPRVMRPLKVCYVQLTLVEQIERIINVKVRKCFGVSRSFNTNTLCANIFIVSLPIKSYVEEYKIGKTSLGKMLKESRDPIIQSCQQNLSAGRKWVVNNEIRDAMFKFEITELVGGVSYR